MIKRLCKIIFSTSQEAEKRTTIVGEVSEKQILSPTSEWITVYTKYLLDNKIHEVESFIHKADIYKIQFYSLESYYIFDKTSLALMSPIFNGMEA